MRESAHDERQGRAWYTQVLGDTINLVAPAILWFGYHHYAAGWYTLGPGIAVQEAQIVTQPTAAISTWNAYKASFSEPRPAWSVTPSLGGLVVAGTF